MGKHVPRHLTPEAERQRQQAAARLQDKMRKRGTPSLVLPHEHDRARQLILKAREFGMDDAMIAAQVDMNPMGIYKIRTGIVKRMRRTTYVKILGNLRPEQATPRRHPTKGKVPDGALRDPSGTQRRLRALRADGWPLDAVASLLGVSIEAVSELARRERKGVYQTTHTEVKAVYEKLVAQKPEDSYSERTVKRCKTFAANHGWAPSICWDDDTIDDPDGFPDWTGECGTEAGYFLHLKYGILIKETCTPPNIKRSVLCTPCRQARTKRVMDDRHKWSDWSGIEDALREAERRGRQYGDVKDIAKAFNVSVRTVHRVAEKVKADRGSEETAVR